MQPFFLQLCALMLMGVPLASAAPSTSKFEGHYEGNAVHQDRDSIDLVAELDVTEQQGIYTLIAEMDGINREVTTHVSHSFWRWSGSGTRRHGTLSFDWTSNDGRWHGKGTLRQTRSGLVLTMDHVRYRLRLAREQPSTFTPNT